VALPLAGTVSSSVHMKGTPSVPELTGTLDLAGAAYDRWVLGDAHFDFSAAKQRVRVDGQLLGGSALSLSVPTAPGLGPATAELRFSDLALDPYLKAALPADCTIGYSTSRTCEIGGRSESRGRVASSPTAGKPVVSTRGGLVAVAGPDDCVKEMPDEAVYPPDRSAFVGASMLGLGCSVIWRRR
jgi:hypothetical protein